MTPREHAVRALALYVGSGNADDHDPTTQREGLLCAIEQEIKTALVTDRLRRVYGCAVWQDLSAEAKAEVIAKNETEVYG